MESWNTDIIHSEVRIVASTNIDHPHKRGGMKNVDYSAKVLL